MSVPNTDTFSLEDVRTELSLAYPTDLSACFSNATDWKFDDEYKGSKDRLSNFRNYGGEKTADLNPDIHQSVYVTGTGWSTVREATTGTTDPEDTQPVKMQQWVESPSADHYVIHRNFMAFDLSDIPSSASIVSAYLEFRVVDEFDGDGTNDIDVVGGTFGTSVTDSDYDSFNTTTFFTGSLSSRTDNGNTIIRKDAGTGDLNNIESSFGGTLKLCIRHSYDYDDNAPANEEKIGYNSWKSGECLTNYFCQPVLHIIYK